MTHVQLKVNVETQFREDEEERNSAGSKSAERTNTTNTKRQQPDVLLRRRSQPYGFGADIEYVTDDTRGRR